MKRMGSSLVDLYLWGLEDTAGFGESVGRFELKRLEKK
jgi:hypothetical protein